MLQPTSFSLLLEEPKPTLVVGLIPQRSLTLFTGGRESGKTILALTLSQGVAAKYVFLQQPCQQFPVAFFSRYGTKDELYRLSQRVAPKLLPIDQERMSLYGCWEPDDVLPEMDGELLDTLALDRFLVFDGIPEPRQTQDANFGEEFLRKAQRLARRGPGVAIFGSEEWTTVQSIKNRVDVHFPIAKANDRITLDALKTGRKAYLDLPHRDTYPFQIKITIE